MYVGEVMEESTSAVDAESIGADGTIAMEPAPLCFIKYLLHERYVGTCAIVQLLKQQT